MAKHQPRGRSHPSQGAARAGLSSPRNGIGAGWGWPWSREQSLCSHGGAGQDGAAAAQVLDHTQVPDQLGQNRVEGGVDVRC